MKSTTCFSKKTGEPRSVYMTEQDAQKSVDYEKQRGHSLYPYRCTKCGYWHLAPTTSRINVQHDACDCRDSNGNPKDLYLTLEDAEKAKYKREAEGSGTLRIYECPYESGYHLTHK